MRNRSSLKATPVSGIAPSGQLNQCLSAGSVEVDSWKTSSAGGSFKRLTPLPGSDAQMSVHNAQHFELMRQLRLRRIEKIEENGRISGLRVFLRSCHRTSFQAGSLCYILDS